MLSIERPVFDAVTAVGMGMLAFGMSVAWAAQFARHVRPYLNQVVAALVLLWVGSLVGDASGLFRRVDIIPPPFLLTGFVCLSLVAVAGFGKVGTHLAQTMSIPSLVALQIFRMPLEFLMLRAATLSIMPLEFSMQGYNLDVLTGAGALALRIYMAATRRPPLNLVRVWNLLGIACLVVIAALAVLTSPFVHAFGDTPAHVNTWILFFPYSLLPMCLVSAAVFGHIVLSRKLLWMGRQNA